MKNFLLFTLIFCFASSLLASTKEEAEILFSQRADDEENALKAALIYADLAKAAPDVMTKAELLYRESEARYYYGTNLKGYWPIEISGVAEVPDEYKKERMAIHKIAYEILLPVMQELKAMPQSDDRDDLLAQVIFFYGANLGKWGENNGPVASLGQWGTLKAAMEEIKDLNRLAETEAYGSYRILGRGFYKLASLPGFGYKKAVTYLKKAYEGSLNSEKTTSIHGLNVLFYAEALVKVDETALAKSILESFIAVNPETLHVGRIPETKVEQEFARKLLATL
ncbi:MAG: hypothetical protein A2381_16180 [Bdellovibrionales bacterium RIFOXYB1_FULL_37_110]|nr:MAG: hypothetical protein A2417_08030 [Bdellovibrionales bacterium RIFOXYC1_FULL_37_79]OFZ57151.1 MAG: hypothetical protein A2381_16180 [Bdellovibrionales bacterium RIFOXYB1_FULL_37_110]OFZ65365.1 MAG: hypothetical protein A2577_03690 [Bdellovibrionales bacterium RIFOXYD1_FULL_36_51]